MAAKILLIKSIKFVKGGSLHVGKVAPGHAAPPEELERAREAGTF